MMGCRLVISVADLALAVTIAISFSLSFALTLSFLVSVGHFFVLLNRPVSLVCVAVSIVRGATWAGILAVHACLHGKVSKSTTPYPHRNARIP